jgi:PAS domain S-box-containing protein
MNEENTEIQALARAFDSFTATTRKMEEAYARLQERFDELDRELAGKNAALTLTTDYLSNLLESMSDGVIAIDTDGHITRFNRAASAILGYRAGDVRGRSFSDIFGRNFTAPRAAGDMKLRAESGRQVPLNERDSPITDENNERIGSVKTFQDLSEIIALREQLRQVDRLAAIGEMAATVAHEIRNPLGGIRGFAAFLAQDIPESDAKRRLVDKIMEGAQSLEKVVNELLEYTRPVELKLGPAGCAGILRAAIAFMNHDNPGITIRDESDPAARILCDADRLRQVFLNVLLNAAQSITGKGEITITTSTSENTVTVAIRDTGCGMTPEQQAQIFSPFFTTREKGTGLGMAVSAKIVEGHGGAIHVESEEGQGTTIRIRLPRAE